MLCADLVDVQWKDKNGRVRRALANLEDISISGACLQVDQPVALQTPMQIRHPKGTLQGHVCYCVYREIGYFVGVSSILVSGGLSGSSARCICLTPGAW